MSPGNSFAGQTASAPRESTLNERLNRSAEALDSQCNRIEAVLARVNGTPTAIGNAMDKGPNVRPTMHMVQMAEQMEHLSQRLTDLANNVERIA